MADKYKNEEEARRKAAKCSFQARDIKPTGISKGETLSHHSSPGGESTSCGKCGAQIEELEKTLNDLKIQLENLEERKDEVERKRNQENLDHWKERERSLEEKDKRLRKTKEEHASVLKDKETEFNSLQTEIRRHLEECELKLKEKEDDITTLEVNLRSEESSYASAIQRQADTQIQLHSNMNDLNNFIKEQGSSITTLNYQLSEKAKIIQGNEKRIRELEIDSKMFQTAAKATKRSSVSRIASIELEQAKEFERARQDFCRKWEEMEKNHSQELMKRETNATEIFEGYQNEIDTQRTETKAVKEKYTKEVAKLKNKVERISTEQQKRKATNKELERKNTDYSNSLRIAGESNRQLSVQIESQKKINSATTKSHDLSQSEAKALKQANDSLQQYLQQREERYRQETEKLNSEIRRLTLRLSKIASAKMTAGNSAIADLSDGFRPTKISELFSELYDNQWTDAFDQLTTASGREEDKDVILLLLEILQESYKTCVSTAQSHLQGVKDAMCNFRIHATQEPVSQENNVTKVDLEVPDESWKMIMDFHKAAAYGSKGEIAKIIYSSQMESRGFRDMNKVGDYMKTCAEICWLMAVQDPPVVVDVLDVPPGCQRSFNKDRYRAYTRTGKFYDFTVWPALLLQKDGPILCKGVAQGK